jgi:DNA adenine methylase
MRVQLKTPISYYGGKQKLLPTIIPMVPQHEIYTEGFAGGAALFWAKEPARVEVINDANKELVNFYRVLKTRFAELQERIVSTLHSRSMHEDAGVIYRWPHLFDEVDRAWALWVQTNMSFTSKILGGWAYGITGDSCEKKTRNGIARLSEAYSQRLQGVQIESGDALAIIGTRDRPETFHYVDPPYPETEQGHYSGYTMEHFRSLLDVLSRCKGKFLLSCYPNEALAEWTGQYGWHRIEKVQHITASKARAGKMKTEVITANYPI